LVIFSLLFIPELYKFQPQKTNFSGWANFLFRKQGRAVYDACPAQDKRLLMIAGANHNDVFLKDMREYMEAARQFVGKLGIHR